MDSETGPPPRYIPLPKCRRCARAEVREGICRWCGDRGGYADDPPPRRDFYFSNETWYFGTGPGKVHAHWVDDRIDAEVMFGLSVPTGGTLGEMAVRWHRQGHGSDSASVPRLEVFCDAWLILGRFGDVIEALAERDRLKTRHHMTPQEFCEVLKTLGFVDATPRHGPPGEWSAEQVEGAPS